MQVHGSALMRARFVTETLFALIAVVMSLDSVRAQGEGDATVREHRVPVGGHVSLYARTIGRGPLVIVLHGGPDFDHAYLLPDMDRWSDRFQLLYYDQRGRGRSADGVRPEDVSLESEIDDLDKVRQHFGIDTTVLLGHSWGTVLALEYALRHPERVSHLILMNPAPASAADFGLLRQAYAAELGSDMDRQRELVGRREYQAGDPETVAARYRIHFKHALKKPADYERLMATMKAQFVQQGKAGILKARAVEDELMRDTWEIADYDLLPQLSTLRVPTLVIGGDHDFIPSAVAEHIARAIPDAELVTIKDCGHFAYLECASAVGRSINEFFGSNEIELQKH